MTRFHMSGIWQRSSAPTVLAPSSVAARMMRKAISPRLAAMTFLPCRVRLMVLIHAASSPELRCEARANAADRPDLAAPSMVVQGRSQDAAGSREICGV